MPSSESGAGGGVLKREVLNYRIAKNNMEISSEIKNCIIDMETYNRRAPPTRDSPTSS